MNGGKAIRRRLYTFAGCLLALSTMTGMGAAASSRAYRATAVYAAASLRARTPVTTKRCRGYSVTRGTFSGGASSPDRRLAGTMVYQGRIAANKDGNGYADGKLYARDAQGKTRMTGRVLAVVSGGSSLDGILMGKLIGPNARLLANVTIAFDPRFTTAGVRLGFRTSENSAVAYSPIRKC